MKGISSDRLLFQRVIEPGEIPFHLLLLADETLEAIGRYIDDSDIYIAKRPARREPLAVFVLHRLNFAELEIKNIAVATEFQGAGIGSRLLDEIKYIARNQGRQTIWVGTPDIARREIRFYERNGFQKAGLKKNFFTDNYPAPIFDDGIRLRDMQMLKMDIS